MSRYDWPSGPGDRRFRTGRGNAGARRAYNLDLHVGSDPEALADARALRHDAGQDPAAAAAAGDAALSALAAAPTAEAAAGMTAVGGATLAMVAPPSTAPNPDRDLWLPLGPATTLRGGGDSEPRVAGRVRDVAVSPNGLRAYAASALGGLWYTDTAGARWTPVGAWAMVSNPADLAASSHTLSCGAVHVLFDPGNDAAQDEVWLATGEPGRYHTAPFDIGIRGPYGGVGILHAMGPVAQTVADPWTRQAQPRTAPAYPGLRGAGVFRLAPNPANARSLVAATTRGLHHNGTGQADPWGLVTVRAWEALFPGISATVAVTDAAWTPATSAHPARLWVAVVHEAPAGLTGVWVSQNGVAGPFTRVVLPDVVNAAGSPQVWRLGFAAHPSAPDVLYVLGSGPRLWRIDGTTPHVVGGLPATLFTAVARDDRDQSDYDLAVAVDPANASRVLVGGSGITSPISPSENAACLYRLTLGSGPPYATDYAGSEASDPTWVGAEVHADVHRIWWGRVGGSGHVWVCCDGGVFRSQANAQLGSFVSRSTGLSVTEAGFLAAHPLSDGVLLTGVQDNGVQLRIGESVWRRVLPGDGGGVAFHPGEPGRFVGQYIRAQWRDEQDDDLGPAYRGLPSPAFDGQNGENASSRFYSNAAVVRRPDGVTQLAVGTTRVWYSEQWGLSQLDPVTGLISRQWVTLPGGTDPRSGNANDATTDLVPPGPQPHPAEHARYARGVRALRWSGPDRLYVLMQGALYRLDRSPATTGTWTRASVVIRPAPPLVIPPLSWPSAAANLPFTGSLNDLAVHNHSAGAHGSLYLATSHPLEPVWWFDGTGRWHPARLGTEPTAPPAGTPPPLPAGGVRAPAYAVVVDPDDRGVVYVGTTVGVWRGVLTLTAGVPSWTWAPFYSGLPEAAVQDLVLATWPRPGGGPPLKLLRAALQSRGVWEVEPGADAAPTTFLRVHPYDTRRLTPTDVRNPLWHLPRPEREWPLDWADRRNRDFLSTGGQPVTAPDGTPADSFFWHASPDIRLRPAPGAGPAVPPPAGIGRLPWITEPDDRFWLWSLQTALRSRDPAIVADGRWTRWFARRLAALRVTLGLDPAPGRERVDAALWNHPSIQAAFWNDPWADGGPTEADLIERVVGMATPRLGGAAGWAVSPASLAVLARPYRVEVCLHHRGRVAPAATDFAVVLLRAPLPASPADWERMPTLTPTPTALAAVRTALDALPDVGGALPPSLALPAGWSAVDSTRAVRRPARPAVNGAPAVVTFEASFPTSQRGTQWVFVALAHSRADPLALSGANLKAMVLGSRHAAARSVQVV